MNVVRAKTLSFTHYSEGPHLTGMAKEKTVVVGLADRMMEALKAAGSNANQASLKLGVAYSTVNNWLKSVSEPDLGNLAAFAAEYGTTMEYLVTGKHISSRVEAEPRYPSLATFFERTLGLEEDERAFLLGQAFADGDPGDDWWDEQLRAYRKQRKLIAFSRVTELADPARQPGGRAIKARR